MFCITIYQPTLVHYTLYTKSHPSFCLWDLSQHMQHTHDAVTMQNCWTTPILGWYIIHPTGMCRIRRFLAVLRSFFQSSLLCTFSCHPSPPTILPSSLTSSCHLFLGLPLDLDVPKFIYNTLLGILFSSILCMCPNQHNLFGMVHNRH